MKEREGKASTIIYIQIYGCCLFLVQNYNTSHINDVKVCSWF